ncbi:MAG: SUF system NifU family Fe-S cluster assembly protein [Patescibacteria group bacterium]|jgi:nitrogen fixation NifU-like protein
MSFEMYQANVLDHGKNPRNRKKLENANLTLDRNNTLCGDSITLYIKIDDAGIVQEISFEGQGCTISQAATSLFTEYAKGKNIEELKGMDKNDMMKLLGSPVTTAREKCATLPLDALHSST